MFLVRNTAGFVKNKEAISLSFALCLEVLMGFPGGVSS